MKTRVTLAVAVVLVLIGSVAASPATANNTCKADINQDSIVDLSDFTILVYSFFSAIPINPRADINGDGFTDLSDYSIMVAEFGKTCTQSSPEHSPYQGTAPSILSRIEAEHFDTGGQGKAYNDLTPGNEGKFLRLSEDVDIKQSGGATVVGWMQSKEWMVYTVNVPSTGNYRLEIKSGSLYEGRTLQMEITQGSATGVYPSLQVPLISRWEDLMSSGPDTTFYLTQGSAVIRILNSGPDWVDLDWIQFYSTFPGSSPTPVATPISTSTPRPSISPTPTPRPTPTPTPVPSPTPIPSPSPSPSPSTSPAPVTGRGYNPNAQADPTGYIPVSSATYVVATNGNDGNPGTLNQPFRTISKALSVVNPGQSVVVRNGTYNEKVLFGKQGTAQAPVLLQAETKHGVIITGGGNGIQPAQWGGDDSGPNSHGNHYLTVRGFVIDNVTSFNRVLRASTGWKIDDVLISRVPFGINIRGHYVEVTDTIIRDVDSTDAHALVGTDGQSIRISNVLLERVNTKLELKSIANSSITKFLFTKGLVLENITSKDHRGPGLWLDWDNKDFVIRNNIIQNNQGYNYNWEGVALWIEGNPISRGKIYNNTMTGNSGAGIGILESTDIEIYGNIMTSNNQCMEFRNMFRGAERVLRNLNVHDNTCVSPTGGGMTTSIGDWGGWSPSSHNVIINRNTYRSMGSRPLFNWLGTQTYSIAETQSRLGFELNGKQE